MQPLLGFYNVKMRDVAALGAVLQQDLQYKVVLGDRFGIRYASQFAHVELCDVSSCIVQVSVAGDAANWDVQIDIGPGGMTAYRQAFGRMPLYWLNSLGTIWFSTHLKSLLQFVESISVSAEAFHSYCAFSFVPAPLSLIDGICSLEAGSSAIWSKDSCAPQIVKQKNWLLPEKLICSEDEAVNALTEELESAVAAQIRGLPSDRVAVFLSGGLDSAITAAALVRAGLDVTAYSLDFGPHGLSELPCAQEVAQHLGIPLKSVRALPRDVQKAIVPTVAALDTAYGDGVTIPLWLLNRAAAQDGHTIAFNGEGGDQLFGGWTNKPLIASRVYGNEPNDNATENVTATYMQTFHRLYAHEHLMFSHAIRSKIADDDLGIHLNEALSQLGKVPLIHLLRRANLLLKGAQNIQPRASNLSIEHGLNLRSLFCHKPLADWTFSVQPELMLRGSCEKYILKRAVESWLPESIVYREKRGMGVPLTEWCIGPLWGHLGKYLNNKRLSRGGYWQPDIASRLVVGEVSAQFAGRRIGEILWLMLMWEVWLDGIKTPDVPLNRYNAFWPPVPLLRLFKEVVQV